MNQHLHPNDLTFFASLAEAGSLSATARELNVTKAAISKRLSTLEQRLGVGLVNRSTRRMGLTVEGEALLTRGRKILADVGQLERDLRGAGDKVSGLLRINASLGFGRTRIAPLVAEFVKAHPQVQVRLQLSADLPPLSEDSFDVALRFGPPPDARVLAIPVAKHRRLLCATPGYLQRFGHPASPADLKHHNFIAIRQGEQGHGVLKLIRTTHPTETHTVKLQGNLSTDDGSVALQWALDGLGLLHRADWDVAEHLTAGRLLHVLPEFETPSADLYAICSPQNHASARVKAFLVLLRQSMIANI